MSVRIKPCYSCPLSSGCELKAEFRKRVAGLGLRSATFNCPRLAERLAPGTRIVVTMPNIEPAEYGDAEVCCGRREVPATIVTSNGCDFSCVVDQEAVATMVEDGEVAESADPNKIRFRKTMKHSRILQFLDEPKRVLCMFGNPKLPNGKCDTMLGECNCFDAEGLAA